MPARRKTRSPARSRCVSERSEAVSPLGEISKLRRPKFPYHFAVTLALKNSKKKYSTGREICNFIEKYIPGWNVKSRNYTFTNPNHYNEKIHAKEGVRFFLKEQLMPKFDRVIREMMEPFTDRTSWVYGLANPDDWEPMLQGEFNSDNIFDHNSVVTLPSPSQGVEEDAEKKAFCTDELKKEPEDENDAGIESMDDQVTPKEDKKKPAIEDDPKKSKEEQDIRKKEKKKAVVNEDNPKKSNDAQDSKKLELRWIFDMAVLHNGNRLGCSNIFDFVTKNFPEYRRSHQWKQELLGMVAMERMRSIKDILDWQTHYIVNDNEIKEFRKAITKIMDQHPEGVADLDPQVKWDDLMPFELICCINTYLQSKRNMVTDDKPEQHRNNKMCDEDENKDKDEVKKTRKRASGTFRTPGTRREKKPRSLSPDTDWATPPPKNVATLSNERAARVTRRRRRQNEPPPVYDRPNPLLPKPTIVTHVDDDAFVPLNEGEAGSEIGSPFAGVFVPQEFITMSSDFMKSLPEGPGDENDVEFPSDLEGIEPAQLLDDIFSNETPRSEHPDEEIVQKREQGSGEDKITQEMKKDKDEQNDEEHSAPVAAEDSGELSITITPIKSPPSVNLDSKCILLNVKTEMKAVNIKGGQIDEDAPLIELRKDPFKQTTSERDSSIECLGFRRKRPRKQQAVAPIAVDYDSDVIEIDCF